MASNVLIRGTSKMRSSHRHGIRKREGGRWILNLQEALSGIGPPLLKWKLWRGQTGRGVNVPLYGSSCPKERIRSPSGFSKAGSKQPAGKAVFGALRPHSVPSNSAPR